MILFGLPGLPASLPFQVVVIILTVAAIGLVADVMRVMTGRNPSFVRATPAPPTSSPAIRRDGMWGIFGTSGFAGMLSATWYRLYIPAPLTALLFTISVGMVVLALYRRLPRRRTAR